MPVVTPALAVMVVPVTVVITAIGLCTDRCARRGANNCANGCAAPAANSSANARADTGANKCAANGILRTGAGRHDCQRRKGSESKNGLPHDILQPLWICSSTPQQR
jgi:hypothetical protein